MTNRTSPRISFALFFVACIFAFLLPCAAFADDSVPRAETPDYKVAFYASANYHVQDETGARSGYGYEMMQSVSQYMQCTFSYVGYDKTPAECEEMLRTGEVDLYTAARKTDARAAEFAFSKHPAITATTAMNVKVDNTSVVAGDYSTYNGLRIGLLSRHTYNGKVLQFIQDKGIDCEIVYYDTPTDLSNALVNDEVDALVNSYIRTPEDERMVEDFGQTPYYIMARQEDQALLDQIDAAIDRMNVETPNWRVDLFNEYYGSADKNCEFTAAEQALIDNMKAEGRVVRAAANPENKPYSWYEDGEMHGIAVDLFKATAANLGLKCEVIPVATMEEYRQLLASGEADVWVDLGSRYEDEGSVKYRLTDPYLTTTVSVLRPRGYTEKASTLAVVGTNISMKEAVAQNWPDIELVSADDVEACKELCESNSVDGMLLMTYAAQQIAKDDVTNGLQIDILPGVTLDICMGVNAEDNRDFYGAWEKALYQVANDTAPEVVQGYIEQTETPTLVAYLFNHPILLVVLIVLLLLVAFLALLYVLSTRARRRQQRISDQLEVALAQAKEANDAKQDFFSKMSHDIRTPLNAVLGMTQIAKKYEDDSSKLNNALDVIESEGNYLLVLVNSILDVNQLEHGHVELKSEPFLPAARVADSVEMLRPLAAKRDQELSVACDGRDHVVVGDGGRFEQIVMNIVSNAIKYTDVGGRIDVKLECLPGSVWRFACADNGIGMDESFISHIAEDYTRAEDSRVSKTQGTGLGMSLVKGFTERMGGTLRVESKKGEGSTFVVEIPFAEATPEQRQAIAAQAQSRETGKVSFAGKKVLLAEDNALNAEIAYELLKSVGFAIDWAEDGRHAVDTFASSEVGEYYAIFMDMQMPVMDGLEATRAIRACGRPDADVTIIAMTANTFAADKEKCAEAGMTGYVSKPIDVNSIVAALKKASREARG